MKEKGRSNKRERVEMKILEGKLEKIRKGKYEGVGNRNHCDNGNRKSVRLKKEGVR